MFHQEKKLPEKFSYAGAYSEFGFLHFVLVQSLICILGFVNLEPTISKLLKLFFSSTKNQWSGISVLDWFLFLMTCLFLLITCAAFLFLTNSLLTQFNKNRRNLNQRFCLPISYFTLTTCAFIANSFTFLVDIYQILPWLKFLFVSYLNISMAVLSVYLLLKEKRSRENAID